MIPNNAKFKLMMAIESLRTANTDLNEWKALESELTDPDCVEVETIPNFYKNLTKYAEKRQKALATYHEANLVYQLELDA